jgi:hypothetical protein
MTHLLRRLPQSSFSLVRTSVAGLVFLVGISAAFASSAAKIEDAGPLNETAASAALRKILEPDGHKILLNDGSECCDVWMLKEAPSVGKREVDGAVFPELSESELLGVIRFPKAATDFRGDAIAAGAYTMRYALSPNDGNHLGVAPSRDFVLLVPIGADPDPEAKFDAEHLNALSRKANGTKHPAPLDLVQPEGDTSRPTIYQNGDGHWVFVFKLKLQTGDLLPLGLVVKGHAPQ